ncbi:hypothetical protein [Defluviitalea saccharophila]|uniref:Uncharacterized protein n=1 Tax=Defluviitalea saccharophila TaxID=879970 RepID=A0ABZ2Y203_9FIRM
MRGISAFFSYGKIEATTEHNKAMVEKAAAFDFLPNLIFSFLKRYKKAIKRVELISLLPFSVR